MTSEYDSIPLEAKEALRDWAEEGVYPGSCLMACLDNEFVQAITKMDRRLLACAREIGIYIFNRLPLECWGSKKTTEAWPEKCDSLDSVKPFRTDYLD